MLAEPAADVTGSSGPGVAGCPEDVGGERSAGRGIGVGVGVDGSEGTAIVPLAHASFDGDMLVVPYGSELLSSAPAHDMARPTIGGVEAAVLERHYRVHDRDVDRGSAPAGGASMMTRSEERLRTGTELVRVGRARLEVFLVIEDLTITVPLTRQEVRLVHDQLPGGRHVVYEPLSEQTHEVVRHEERAVISTEVVPVERVRMMRRVVGGEQTVTARLNREEIDTSQATTTPPTAATYRNSSPP